jgi:hypothetical protein
MSKGWAKGFRKEDKDVEERKNIYLCAHTRKKGEERKKKRK